MKCALVLHVINKDAALLQVGIQMFGYPHSDGVFGAGEQKRRVIAGRRSCWIAWHGKAWASL